MILRELPDLAPRPLTAVNAGFRQWFAEHWGRENAIVMGWTRDAEFPPHTQTLSIKRAWGGDGEDYLLPARRLRVDADHCLILNQGGHYGARIASPVPVLSFGVFFRPELGAELAHAATQSWARRLADGDEPGRVDAGFAEHLRPADGALGAELSTLRDAVLAGRGECLGDADDEAWLEERLQALLWRMLATEPGWRERSQRLAPISRSQHAELLARLDRAADFMLSCQAQPLTLDDIAGVARLSKYHLVRCWRALHGATPMAWLAQRRSAHALRLLQDETLTLDDVAARSGLGSRQTLFRQLKRLGGAGGQALRGRLSAAL
ncbi:AraC family transcriptional regulator [Roseateles asaccharophilus]|uniref:AraC-like DNA-binding protein n=1 Tax=Roseateles asaccharophilus TaxID=582607 RepID=A0ABU2A2A6_9BURK|nr:AraC family transcriptional regulator [Roseateles asaccharophilus]MDR7331299.1 AraC-like DNA-binding protein [Roseateles asaccharophilus]